MRLSPDAWPTVRKAIRDLLVIPYEEQIDTVMVATFLFNHVLSRDTNVWLVMIAPQGEGKTTLLNLLAEHPSVWKLPDRIANAYFLSARSRKRSALYRIRDQEKKILLQADMSSLTDGVSWQYQGDIATQFIAVCDGHFTVETGLDAEPLEWGPYPPSKTLGFIGAATERFYDWLGRSHGLGSRFVVYYMNPLRARHWSDTTDLEVMQESLRDKALNREYAKAVLGNFITGALEQLEEFDNVVSNQFTNRQIVAVVRLVARILGGNYVQDSGNRRGIQIRELVRMFAFMRGSGAVEQEDIELGSRMALSQLGPHAQTVLSYAMQPEWRGRSWKMSQLLARVGGTRKVYLPILQSMVDVEVLVQTGGRGREGYGYRFTKGARRLVERFDPNGSVYKVAGVAPEPEFEDLMEELEAV